MGDRLSVVAVDWSGRRRGERRAIWCGAARDGALVRLEDGRTRREVAEHLVALADTDRDLVVGLDFSFSLPAWFLRARGYRTVDDLWRAAAAEGDDWCSCREPPFWGLPGTRRPDLPSHLRATEAAVAPVGGIRPKSTFQVSGAGSVGAGSIRGFPVLARLRAAGFAIWPFDDATPPVALEVWPRLLTGPVVKTSTDARARHVDGLDAHIPAHLRARAIASDDAFDAAVSAVVMARHTGALRSLTRRDDEVTRLEGAVWVPPDQANAVSSRPTDSATRPPTSSATADESTW